MPQTNWAAPFGAAHLFTGTTKVTRWITIAFDNHQTKGKGAMGHAKFVALHGFMRTRSSEMRGIIAEAGRQPDEAYQRADEHRTARADQAGGGFRDPA